jgi:uncharacterized protein (TIGR02001 family)
VPQIIVNKEILSLFHPAHYFSIVTQCFSVLCLFGTSVALCLLLVLCCFFTLKGNSMRKSLLLAAVLGTFAAPAAVMAADVAAEEATSPHTFTYNIGLYSQYIFRGLTQTANEAALQGGVDYSHSSGFYLGTWGSNVSWTTANNSNGAMIKQDSSLEWDIYGGYRSTIGDTGIGYDVGVLQYVYPGKKVTGAQDPNTTEVYGALTWKYFTLKDSYVVSDGAFGIDDGRGSNYVDLTALYPFADTGYSLIAHVGYQYFDGTAKSLKGTGVDNDDQYTYTDWKLGVNKAWSNGVNVGGYYTGTDTDSAWKLDGKNIGKDAFTVYVQKTF